jgi:hypothetical protein
LTESFILSCQKMEFFSVRPHQSTKPWLFCHSEKKNYINYINTLYYKISQNYINTLYYKISQNYIGDHRGCDRMVGSWIYSYLCNQCLSPLTLWVRIPLRWDVLNTTLYNKVCQWLATDRSFSPGTPVSSTNKTDRHEITEILLKVASNIINQNKPEFNFNFHFQTWFYIHMYF